MSNTTETEESLKPKKPKKGYTANGKKIGRPRTTDLEAKKSRGKVGRPKGDTGIINDYKARMLASPKSQKVIDAIFSAATDPDHKHFTAAAKLVMDRILPLSYFDKNSIGSGRASVNISITTLDGSTTVIGSSDEEVLEGEYEIEQTETD